MAESSLTVVEGGLQAWTPRFVLSVDQAVELVKEKRRFFEKVMEEKLHYGRIPGMPEDAKPALYKAGAELLNASMGLHPVLMDAEPPLRDYSGEAHAGEPFWSFRKVCRIYRQTGPGELDRMVVAEADGSCNSFEVKYRYRQRQWQCPSCKVAAILRAKPSKGEPEKPEEELGFFCWRKRGGCGENFHHDDERILSQQLGRGPNPDIFDLENTGLKMAGKRALVAATLIATGCSDIFTQDLEDRADTDEPDGQETSERTPQASSRGGKGMTPEQQAELRSLAQSLPRPPEPRILEAMFAAGYPGALAALRKKHQEQCCNDEPECICQHLAKPIEAKPEAAASGAPS